MTFLPLARAMVLALSNGPEWIHSRLQPLGFLGVLRRLTVKGFCLQFVFCHFAFFANLGLSLLTLDCNTCIYCYCINDDGMACFLTDNPRHQRCKLCSS